MKSLIHSTSLFAVMLVAGCSEEVARSPGDQQENVAKVEQQQTKPIEQHTTSQPGDVQEEDIAPIQKDDFFDIVQLQVTHCHRSKKDVRDVYVRFEITSTTSEFLGSRELLVELTTQRGETYTEQTITPIGVRSGITKQIELYVDGVRANAGRSTISVFATDRTTGKVRQLNVDYTSHEISNVAPRVEGPAFNR